MTTKHTPGPWFVAKHATPGSVYQAGVYSNANDGRDLAIVTSSEWDARLIEAAPELLEAAARVIEAWKSGELAGAVLALERVVYEASSA